MKAKTFIDKWDEEHNLIGFDIYGYDDGHFTINDGTFVLVSFIDEEDLIKTLGLNEEEQKLLENDCNFYVNLEGEFCR